MTCLVYWNYSTIFAWFSNSFFSLFSLFPILRIHFNWHHRTLFPRIKPFSKSTINSIAHQLKNEKEKENLLFMVHSSEKAIHQHKKGFNKNICLLYIEQNCREQFICMKRFVKFPVFRISWLNKLAIPTTGQISIPFDLPTSTLRNPYELQPNQQSMLVTTTSQCPSDLLESSSIAVNAPQSHIPINY